MRASAGRAIREPDRQRRILSDAGRITCIGAALGIPPGDQAIDLRDATCLPGLIDVHVHLTSDPVRQGYQSLGISVPRSTITGVKSARLTLQAGFATVRNVGADGYSDVALRDGIEAGEIDGPRMFVFVRPWGSRVGIATRICSHPSSTTPIQALPTDPEPLAPGSVKSSNMKRISLRFALGRKVAAHAHGTQSIKDAIRAGIDSVEHASLIDDEGIALAKQHSTFLVFDIYNDDFILQEGAKKRHAARNRSKRNAPSANCNARTSAAPCWAAIAWRSAPMRELTHTAITRASSQKWSNTA